LLFDGEQAADMTAAVNRALALFGSPDWRSMQRNAMRGDFSWVRPAQQYIALYLGIVAPEVSGMFVDALQQATDASLQLADDSPAPVPLNAALA
jgi:hypothetical protein